MSCVDTILLPDDKTVEEDFWQTKEQVSMMVNGAYLSMANSAMQERFIIWTMRSDELNVNTSLNNSNLNQIYTANIQTTNGYCNWGDLYTVINNCNLVIDKSAEVMDIDPNYLEGDHNNNVAQMKALRALAYFYLIRVFRDVPLVLEPYKESSQEMNVSQSAPSVVLDQIIADLEEVKDKTLMSSAGNSQQYITRDAAYAILADAYLWKASVYGDIESYDNCIKCCDVVRKNRSGRNGGMHHFGPNTGGMDDDGFGLSTARNYYESFTNPGNDEPLFMAWYENNTALCNAYYKTSDKSTAQPRFYTSEIYAKAVVDDDHVFNLSKATTDVRGFESVWMFNGSAEDGFQIRKFVAENGQNGGLNSQSVQNRPYNGYRQNWMFYRVTDVMLMKAEALAQKGLLKLQQSQSVYDQLSAGSGDRLALANQLRAVNEEVSDIYTKSARLAQIVNQRANTEENVSDIDSTKYSVNYEEYDNVDLDAFVQKALGGYTTLTNNASTLEKIILNERARELCFEGKRWFDMLRYNYRHTKGAAENYSILLADQPSTKYAVNYAEMLKLIARKYTSGGGAGVTAKMPTEPYLYLPIIKGEMDVNPNLKQNPVYTDGGTIEKNY